MAARITEWAGRSVEARREMLRSAQARVRQIEEKVNAGNLARETRELGRFQFDAGDIELVSPKLYEKAVTDAQLLLISAPDYFSSQTDYREVLALDPLKGE